ncbi:MAG: hypothetical protein K2Q22_13580, partial [Cytophagales bacterium]|nr:hypothetical protein [Cytophagales bacterium]
MNCYCCSGKDFTDCCAGYLQGQTLPSTAELLMRSRYSAYATVQVDYLIGTTHPSTRKQYDPNSIRQWAKANQWLRLEIISTKAGSEQDKKGTVEF